MPRRPGDKTKDLPVSPESKLLRRRYEHSGMTLAELASATGKSVGTVTAAVSGFRYRDGEAAVVVPTDQVLVLLASALHITPAELHAVDRERAAQMLAEANALGGQATGDQSDGVVPADVAAQAAIMARRSLTQRVLSVFSTDDLREEIARRENG